MVAVCPETENIGLLEDKVPMFCLESTEVCLKEVRCFSFPKPILPKKSFLFFSYIPTPILESPFIYWVFRVKDRV